MNTEIHSLQLLERDIEAVVRRERIASVEGRGKASGSFGPDLPPRRRRGAGNRNWGGVAAALVAVLVLAGGVGFLSQGMSDNDSRTASGSAAGGSEEVPRPANADAPGSGGFTTGGAGQASAVPAPADQAAGVDVDKWAGLTDSERAALNYSTAQLSQGAATGAGNRQGVGAVPNQMGDLTKIIRDGRIGIVIADGSFSKGVSRVTQIARSNGGFVLESTSRDERSGTLTLRSPARRFDDAMLALRGLAEELQGEVEFQDISGQDVTAEFIDLGARLEILQDRRDLLRDIQADATSSSEILRLGALIDEVQLEIETIQGRLNFLKDQVAEATIKVEVRERDVQREDPGPNPDNPSLADSFELAVQGFLRILGAIVIGLGYLIPVGVIAALVWGAVRLVRRRDRKNG